MNENSHRSTKKSSLKRYAIECQKAGEYALHTRAKTRCNNKCFGRRIYNITIAQ